MTWRPRPLTVCGLVPTLLAAVLCLARPSFLQRLELTSYDTILRAAPVRPTSGRVIIVDVDEKSLAAVGQWPWRRDLIGRLVSKLRDAGASAVALDIIFAEPDRYEGTAATPDEAFAAALAPGRVVLGYGMTFDQPGTGAGGCVQHPLTLAVLRHDDSAQQPYFEATGVICSLPSLARAAGASGFLNAAPDNDGLLRRAPVVMTLEGNVYPALGFSAVSAIRQTRDVSLDVEHANAATLMATSPKDARSSWEVPLDGRGNLLLRYRGRKRTFPYVSAADVLNGGIVPGTFLNKLVLVGTTALGTREVVSTPLDTLFTGVEVQATIADNLLQRDFIHRPAYGVVLETLLVLLLGGLASVAISRLGLVRGALLGVCLVPLSWAGAVTLLTTHGAFLSPLFPTISLCGVLASTTLASFTIERRRAEREGVEKQNSRRLMIQSLLSLTEIRDAETGKHSRRTQQYTRILAQEVARNPAYASYLTAERIDLLATLAPLHDIGKVGVPDAVLNKPGKLTPEELAEMRKHPVHGRDVILKAEQATGVEDDATLSMAKDIVYTHHEKWDGTGYPEGLKGEAIPIAGRVMAVVDVYDASTTRRLYTQSLSQDEGLALIVKGRGTHFDPAVVDAFLVVAPVMRSLSENGHDIDDLAH
jgi:adenylate cyclase